MSERKGWDGKFVHRLTKIGAYDAAEDKARHKLVRADNGADVPGEICAADEASGECMMEIAGEKKVFSLGPGGFRIVDRTR